MEPSKGTSYSHPDVLYYPERAAAEFGTPSSKSRATSRANAGRVHRGLQKKGFCWGCIVSRIVVLYSLMEFMLGFMLFYGAVVLKVLIIWVSKVNLKESRGTLGFGPLGRLGCCHWIRVQDFRGASVLGFWDLRFAATVSAPRRFAARRRLGGACSG